MGKQLRHPGVEQARGVLLQQVDGLEHHPLVRALQHPHCLFEDAKLAEGHGLPLRLKRQPPQVATEFTDIATPQTNTCDQPDADQRQYQGRQGGASGIERQPGAQKQNAGKRIADTLDARFDDRLGSTLDARLEREEQQLDRRLVQRESERLIPGFRTKDHRETR